MKRSHFFIIAAFIPALFGLVMMLAPSAMLDNSLTEPAHPTTIVVTRWIGFAVLSIGLITFLSRSDPGSPALKAVMVGNIVFHGLGIGFDVYGYLTRSMTASGLISGMVPHTLLAVGFVYYRVRLSAPEMDPAVRVAGGGR